MPLKAVFIDVGQTLLYEKPSRAAIYADAARRRGATVDEPEMARAMARAHSVLPRVIDGAYRYTDRWFRHFIAQIFLEQLDLDPTVLPGLEEELFARFSDPDTFRLYPGAEEVLAGLGERDLVVGVISNWSERLPGLLDRLGLARHLDVIACSAIVRAEKPEPAIFRAALELAGAAPGEALHAGDHPEKDVEGARHAGLSAVIVDHVGRSEGEACVHGLRELLDYVDERLR